jgi:hypothetical protein
MDTSSSSSKEEKKTADADEIIVDIESHISQNQITRKRLFLIIASYGTSHLTHLSILILTSFVYKKKKDYV